MKAIKIYAQDSKYFMEDLETNQTVELTDIRQDPKGTGDYIVLPENSANRKFCKTKKADMGIILEYKESRTLGPHDTKTPKTPKMPKIDWTKYLTEDEQKIVNEIKARCEERAQEDIKKAKIEALKAEIARLMGEA